MGEIFGMIDGNIGSKKKGRRKKMTAKQYELLALSRMTGEQIMNELSPEERKEYARYLSGEE